MSATSPPRARASSAPSSAARTERGCSSTAIRIFRMLMEVPQLDANSIASVLSVHTSREPVPPLSIVPVLFPSCTLAAHLLQELAQSVQLRPETRPIPGLQALDRLVVAIECLAGALCRCAF